MISGRPITRRQPRIGLFAEVFGFGPVSKACTIGHACVERLHAQLCPVGTSIVKDFFETEGLGPVAELDIRSGISSASLAALTDAIDVAVVSVQPQWACAFHGRIPTLYIDSLGFMWDQGFFRAHPELLHVDAYVTQDLFGAAARLRGFGVRNVNPVGAIVRVCEPVADKTKAPIVQLGGLVNMFSETDGFDYARFALGLIDGLSQEVLVTARARTAQLPNEFRVLSVSNYEAIKRFSSAQRVYTSPGLTSLLELASLGALVVPLPPQNYSQVLSTANIAQLLPQNFVWNFLADRYTILRDLPEGTAVQLVRRLNQEHARSSDFRSEYRQAIEATADHQLPAALQNMTNGTQSCVDIVTRLLERQ